MMETVAEVIAFVGILVFLAHLFSSIFSRTKIPDVILLMIIGICVGPVLKLASPSLFGSVGPVFTTITLIIILFEGGLALKLDMLRSALSGAMILAPLSFFATMFIVAGFAVWLTDLEVLPAFILGAIVGSTSEAVVIPLVRQMRIREETQTLLSVESSVNDVLSIVVTIALVQAYTVEQFDVVKMLLGNVIASFLVALVFGILGALIWSVLLNRVRAIKNAIFTTPAFVFVIFGLVEILGFSGAIAALSFGVTIGNIEKIKFPVFKTLTVKEPVGLNETERIFFSEVAFLLKTFFFIYLGISLELISNELIIVGLILTAIAFVIRVPAVRLISKNIASKDASVMAVMVPKGLAAVVLASIPLQQGVNGAVLIKDITYSVVLFSIVLTAFFVILLEKTKLSSLYALALTPKRRRRGRKRASRPGKPGKKKTVVLPDILGYFRDIRLKRKKDITGDTDKPE